MTKVGHFVTDPKVGAYCQITLDGGGKVIVNHDQGSLKAGTLTIEVSKFMGLSSDRLFVCDLDTPDGQRVLAWLTRGAEPGSVASTPLGAVVEFVKEAGTLAELKARCAALAAAR